MKYIELNFYKLSGTFADNIMGSDLNDPFIYWWGDNIDDLMDGTLDTIRLTMEVDKLRNEEKKEDGSY